MTTTFTITGDGTTTVFPTPHGLSTTPDVYFNWGDANTKAECGYYGNPAVTADSTNIIATFSVPPALGVVLTLNVIAQ